MKSMSICLLLAFFLVGCAELGVRGNVSAGKSVPAVVFQSTDASYILACMEELQGIKKSEFSRYFKTLSAGIDQRPDEDKLRLICLSLNPKASYKQFRMGVTVLQSYIESHPGNRADLKGLLALAGRLDQAKIQRWSGRKKLKEEKKNLEQKIDELNNELQQREVRIHELQQQIEQLKNIENIIKNREHSAVGKGSYD
ncbi:hypothetical protein [Desulfolithobacter sp.]